MQSKPNPGVSAVLSFFIPGLGHIYNSQLVKGLLIFFAFTACGIFTFFYAYSLGGFSKIPGFWPILVALALWLYGLFSAHDDAKRILKKL